MDWKILAAIIVAVAIVVSGLITTDVFSNVLSGLKQGFGGFLSSEKGNISFSAALKIQDTINTDTSASSIILDFSPNSDFYIGNEKFDFNLSSVLLEINNFTGNLKIEFSNKTISINGNLEKILITNIGIIPHKEKTVSVRTENLKVDSIKIYDISLQRFSYIADGTINTDKAVINIDNEQLELGKFDGNIEVSDTVNLNGLTDKILISGKQQISIQ